MFTYHADLHWGWSCPDAVGGVAHIRSLQLVADWTFEEQDVVSDFDAAQNGAIDPAEGQSRTTKLNLSFEFNFKLPFYYD